MNKKYPEEEEYSEDMDDQIPGAVLLVVLVITIIALVLIYI